MHHRSNEVVDTMVADLAPVDTKESHKYSERKEKINPKGNSHVLGPEKKNP